MRPHRDHIDRLAVAKLRRSAKAATLVNAVPAPDGMAQLTALDFVLRPQIRDRTQ